MNLTISTIGIIDIDSRSATPYSLKLRLAREKAFARKSISITAVVKTKDNIPAPISHKFRVFILNIEPLSERILNAWNISDIESVKNAIDVPIVSGEYLPTYELAS